MKEIDRRIGPRYAKGPRWFPSRFTRRHFTEDLLLHPKTRRQRKQRARIMRSMMKGQP